MDVHDLDRVSTKEEAREWASSVFKVTRFDNLLWFATEKVLQQKVLDTDALILALSEVSPRHIDLRSYTLRMLGNFKSVLAIGQKAYGPHVQDTLTLTWLATEKLLKAAEVSYSEVLEETEVVNRKLSEIQSDLREGMREIDESLLELEMDMALVSNPALTDTQRVMTDQAVSLRLTMSNLHDLITSMEEFVKSTVDVLGTIERMEEVR